MADFEERIVGMEKIIAEFAECTKDVPLPVRVVAAEAGLAVVPVRDGDTAMKICGAVLAIRDLRDECVALEKQVMDLTAELAQLRRVH